MVEILRISSYLWSFSTAVCCTLAVFIYSFGRKRRFFLKSAYPLYQTEEAASNLAFETASYKREKLRNSKNNFEFRISNFEFIRLPSFAQGICI